MSQDNAARDRGYGNIYTPHAGSMVIHVQREGGLANRTLILSERRVKVLRLATSRTGVLTGIALAITFLFLAVQAIRVPILTHRIAQMESDRARIDTLQRTLQQLQDRYVQVQNMLGTSLAPVPVHRPDTPAPARPELAAPMSPATPDVVVDSVRLRD